MPEATLQVQNELHQNACTKKGLKTLNKRLLALDVALPATAWQAVEVLLCGSMTKENIQFSEGLLLPEVEGVAKLGPSRAANISCRSLYGKRIY